MKTKSSLLLQLCSQTFSHVLVFFCMFSRLSINFVFWKPLKSASVFPFWVWADIFQTHISHKQLLQPPNPLAHVYKHEEQAKQNSFIKEWLKLHHVVISNINPYFPSTSCRLLLHCTANLAVRWPCLTWHSCFIYCCSGKCSNNNVLFLFDHETLNWWKIKTYFWDVCSIGGRRSHMILR